MMEERRMEKYRQHLIHPIIKEEGLPCLAAIISASLLQNVVHSLPMLPVDENTKWVKTPCSISRTL